MKKSFSENKQNEEFVYSKIVISIRQKMENIKDIVMSFKILKERISQAEII
jgi:hypothetical protein